MATINKIFDGLAGRLVGNIEVSEPGTVTVSPVKEGILLITHKEYAELFRDIRYHTFVSSEKEAVEYLQGMIIGAFGFSLEIYRTEDVEDYKLILS